ncbi:MAG TPA: CRTAC1 family protein [Cyclobacteriaceae bacterium]|nr:CRTAC1 family protein [Cyclobacteriaceae bacterium]
MSIRSTSVAAVACIILLWSACQKADPHEQMLKLLAEAERSAAVANNPFHSSAKLSYVDSMLTYGSTKREDLLYHQYLKGSILLELGKEDDAIQALEELRSSVTTPRHELLREIAMAYLRKGERSNCVAGHEAESCIVPISGLGVHRIPAGSLKAIEEYTYMLKLDPNDLESRWLLNIAYMTLGQYPSKVPKEYLLPGLEGDTTIKVNAFREIASDLGLTVNNMAGGSITDDFDGDGYLDIVTSSMDLTESMHYFKNNADGTFTELSKESGLASIRGGLNMTQADYDNDGDKDILVLRGAWKRMYGKEPNSLLQNQGNGTFRDVTTASGILSFHPTQTATWNDFNNDGWLDVFIGNESVPGDTKNVNPCELYMNDGDGTFTNIAKAAGVDFITYVKGVTSGDYNNDGWKDLFLSTMSEKRILLKNNGLNNGDLTFTDVSNEAGIKDDWNTFPTWFWDYDNDGWLDIFACDYSFEKTLAYYAAADKLNKEAGSPDKMLLYHNNGDGTFTNVAKKAGLTNIVFAMGSNYGDIDNDGFLDMYLGTGNPPYQSVIPNKMFKNMGGGSFADVTRSAAVGHLQKGHGVSFADLDNDGDQDIYIEMGGAYKGDAYQNAFFMNPGQGNNNWINVELVGKTANKGAIGTRVKVTFRENGITRSVYRDVNSGGSFGSLPLRREIGIGKAAVIDDIEIQWHGSNAVQHFTNVKPNEFIKITEGSDVVEKLPLKRLNWTLSDPLCLPQ